MSDVVMTTQDDFLERLFDAWGNGVECMAYIDKTGQWYPCYIKAIDIDPSRRVVTWVEIVIKDTVYSVLLNRVVIREYLRIPLSGKTVDDTDVVIDGKKLLGRGNV